MLNQDSLKTIKGTVEEFFKRIAIDVEIVSLKQDESTIFLNLKSDHPQILIGESGQTLSEIQHLLKLILRKKIKEQFYLNLDINSYKSKKTEYLRELAREVADHVSLTKKEKTLPSMPAYERRVIHMELAERKDVVSESVDQEPERKVVIKPSS